jgi:thiamine-monophosphate kinase
MKRTRIQNQTAKTLGEHRIIQIIQSYLTPMPNMPIPFGDDISGVNINKSCVGVLKTDMLVAKTDVPKGMSLWQAARKALIMNISDFASKGAKPTAALIALGLPSNFTQKNIEDIAQGLNSGAQEYGVYIIGGDTSEASDLIVSVSLFGSAEKSELMLRSGAREGDVLAVTGYFGKSSAGLRLLLGGCSVETGLRKILLEAVLLPKAKLAEGLALGGCGGVSAAIDSSDGLAWSLYELGRLSGVGFLLNRIPLADEAKQFAIENGLNASEIGLYGGEEYELVITVKPEMWAKAVASVEAVGGRLLPIGKATREKQILLEIDGKLSPIEARGWEHFKSRV